MDKLAHFEIHAEDPQKMASFYRDVFGWEVRKWENPAVDYWIIMTCPENTPAGINGGIVKRQGPKPKDGQAVNAFVCTMVVASVDDYVRRVLKAGGTIALPKMPIPGVGWLAYCKDIEGNIFGMMQDDKNAK